MSINRTHQTWLAALLCTLACQTSLLADIIASDNFSNATDSGTGWSDSWTKTGTNGSGTVMTLNPDLIYSNLTSTGAAANSGGGKYLRTLSAAQTSGTVWISSLIQSSPGTNFSYLANFTLVNGSTEKLSFGASYNGTITGTFYGSWRANGTQFTSSSILLDTNVHFIVAEVNTAGTANVWVDPATTGTLGSPTYTVNAASGDNFGFDKIRIETSPGGTFSLDEVRIGTTLEDVRPLSVPPAPLIIASDNFSSSTNSGTGWSDNWTKSGTNGTGTEMTLNSNLTFSNLTSTGSSANAGGGKYFRFLTTPHTIGTIWVSCLIDSSPGGGYSYLSNLAFFNQSSNNAGDKFSIGASYNSTATGTNYGSWQENKSMFTSSGIPLDTNVHFVVASINAAGSASVWIDPATTGPLGTPTYTLTAPGTNNFNFDRVRIETSNGANFSIDEIRFGNNADAVRPTTVTDSYLAWITTYFPLTDPRAGSQEDPDGDNVSNIIEFINGSLPDSNDSAYPVAVTPPNAGLAKFTYRRTIASEYLLPEFEVSPDLSTWQKAVNGENGVTITSSVIDAITNSIEVSLTSGDRHFGRMKVPVP